MVSRSAPVSTGGVVAQWHAWSVSPKGELASSILAGAFLLAGFVLKHSGAPEAGQALYFVSLGLGMVHGLRAAWASLSRRVFDIDVLMAVAAVLAAATGNPGEGALLLFLFVLAGALEDLATARTTRAVEALHGLMPTKALKLDSFDGGEHLTEVLPETLIPGDVVRVLPGELIPTDGEVIKGESAVDQATLTGESMPRSVVVGSAVFAGTINASNPLTLRVTKPAKESSLQRVLNLVLEAQQQREPVQRLIDKVNQPYAVGVLVLSIIVFLIWWLGFGDTWSYALLTAITLLIVASPCAVIIATPTATLAAITRGARAGVLFKGGQAIERIGRIRGMAFDKTGTLTVGKMRVHELHPIGWSDARTLLAAAAGLERDSTHPIAKAVIQAAKNMGVESAPVDDPMAIAGRGVSGHVQGHEARLGSLAFTRELIPVCLQAQVQTVLRSVQSRGQIGVVIAHDQQAGVIILSDTVRPGAKELVAHLHEIGVRPVVMLTGDNTSTAASVAEQLGLDEYRAELLPQHKLAAVEELRRTVRARVPRGGMGVIGDGVNDAPALAAADASLAIGSIGSDAAMESSDAVLLADDLRVVPWAIELSRRTRTTILFNLSFALGAIVLMVIATLVGSRFGRPLPMWMGVLGHEGGTLLVVANSLLLLVVRGPRGSVEVLDEHTQTGGGVAIHEAAPDAEGARKTAETSAKT